MDKKNIFVVLVVSAIVSALVGFASTTKTVQTVIHEQPVGSVVSSEIPDNNFSVGGLRQWKYGPKMNVATTTLCAIKSPAATSSLISAAFQVYTGTSTAATIDIGTSTNAYSTTTNLAAAFSIGSSATGANGWTSVGGSVQDNVMAPNTYVVVKTAGAGLGGYTYGGRCSVVFQEF